MGFAQYSICSSTACHKPPQAMVCCSSTSSSGFEEEQRVMSTPSSDSAIVYIGTYTPTEAPAGEEVNGIYVYRLDMASGALHYLSAVAGLANPSYLAVDPQRRYLYAVQELETHA